MTTSIFVQPSFTTQDAASYKAAIDAAIAVISKPALQFAPREQAVLGMGITIEAGVLMDGVVINATSITGIGVPAVNPRIDRIYLDLNTRLFVRVVGVVAATPVPPALPLGVYPIAQVLINPTDTVIANSQIIDERTAVMVSAAYLRGDGYTTIVDPDGLIRVLMGKTANDPRVIVRLHTIDATSKVQFQNSAGATIAELDGTGALKIKGVLTQSVVFP